MAGVVTALIAHDNIEALGQQIDDLAFAFIAPLGANDCDNHETKEVRDQKSDIRKNEISDSKFQRIKYQTQNRRGSFWNKQNRARNSGDLGRGGGADKLVQHAPDGAFRSRSDD